MSKNTVAYPVRVTITEEENQRLAQSTKYDPGATLETWCTYWAKQHLNGGVFLTSKDLGKIRQSTEVEITSADDVVKAVQEAKGREGGQYTLKVSVDPAYTSAIKQTAEWQGVTPDQLVSDTVNIVLENGWAYQLDQERGIQHFRMTDAEVAAIEKALGRKIRFGRDIVEAVAPQAVAAQ